ncbi:MAG TPA: flavodoxin family protein [Candidatus Deferrimicrobium sp.]|nr:flavodoxin family protein [Candidatus Deferrimicrobium sp.]
MKILICYHSDTGNTEAVAKSMAEGLAGEQVTILPAKEVDPASLNNYDVAFFGSGIYGSALGKSLKNLLKDVTAFPLKVVLFCTHANPEPSTFEKAFTKVKQQIRDADCNLCDQFDCIGENRNPQIVEILLKTMPIMKGPLEAAKGHPNAQDLETAKEFAKSIISKL